MKRAASPLSFALVVCLAASTPLSLVSIATASNAQTASNSNELYYSFGNQKISLSERKDSIAVALSTKRASGGKSSISKLQDDFGSNFVTRGSGTPKAGGTQIQSLSNNFALLTALQDPTGGSKLQQQAQKKSYVDSTLPVLKIAGKSNSLILPNEMIVSFKPDISAAQQQEILAQNQLIIVKELRFAQGFYKVKSTKAKGLGVLAVSNNLNKIKGVDSSMPNFIEVQSSPLSNFLGSGNSTSGSGIKIKNDSTPAGLNPADIRSSQWHIDSRPMMTAMGIRSSRTDVRAPEAWSKGKKGDDVVVAVIDNLIQWDHPALAGKIYKVDCAKAAQEKLGCLPGEEYGWDFTSEGNGDNDTRVSAVEVDSMRPGIIESTQPESFLLRKYAPGIEKWKNSHPGATDTSALRMLRRVLRSDAIGSFHGTMSAGMIAGAGSNGFQGIAPNVKILPVRAGGLGQGLSNEAILMSMAYSALRGADVINMSFGSDAPSPSQANLIGKLSAKFPKLVFVAAAGNETNAQVGYPAGVDGVIAVGAINVRGNRASYSNFGKGITVVAPGGDTTVDGGVLTLSGVGANGFWSGTNPPSSDFAPFQDNRGYYVFTTGTSFASPAVAGVVALMKSADPQRKLTAAQYRDILTSTSSREGLSLISEEAKAFASTVKSGSPEQFFFGSGLVNAEKAVIEVEKRQK
jgi:serine protease